MKTLFILGSVMVILFLAASDKVRAQSKQPKSTLPEITTVKMPEALAGQVARDDNGKNKSCQLCGTDAQTFVDGGTTRSLDLNGDGKPEWIISFCGSQACSGWIYRKVGERYEMIFAGDAGSADYTVPLATVRNGYRDLSNDPTEGTTGGFVMILKYDGRHYKLTECLEYTPIYNRAGKFLRRKLFRRGPCPK